MTQYKQLNKKARKEVLKTVYQIRKQTGYARGISNLKEQDYSNMDLSGLNLSNLSFFEANLKNSNLENTNLSNSNLMGTDLRNTNLNNTDLRNTQLGWGKYKGVKAQNAHFTNESISNEFWYYARI